jgi:hypothetical protein
MLRLQTTPTTTVEDILTEPEPVCLNDKMFRMSINVILLLWVPCAIRFLTQLSHRPPIKGSVVSESYIS